MRNSNLAVIISSILLGAAAAHADPATAYPSAQEAQQQATTSTSTTSTTTTQGAIDPRESSRQDTTDATGTVGAAGGRDMKAREHWTKADIDGNGMLSLPEIQASMPTMADNFAQMDTNGDGELSSDEMHSYKMQRGQREMRQQFSAADRDGDNMIDQAEAQGIPALSGQFATVDSNSDGKVSVEEMRAHHLAMGKDWREARKTLHEADKESEADERRMTTSSTSTTSTATTVEKDDADTSTTSER